VLVSSIVLYKLYQGALTGEGSIGSGLNALLQQKQPVADEDTQAIQDLVAKSTAKEFDFYEVLPDIETVMPDDLPDTEAERARPERDYYVQAASFRKHADAEKLRARLALKGFKSSTQSRTSEERGNYYRVKLGPYENKREAKKVVTKLRAVGVKPIVTSIERRK